MHFYISKQWQKKSEGPTEIEYHGVDLGSLVFPPDLGFCGIPSDLSTRYLSVSTGLLHDRLTQLFTLWVTDRTDRFKCIRCWL